AMKTMTASRINPNNRFTMHNHLLYLSILPPTSDIHASACSKAAGSRGIMVSNDTEREGITHAGTFRRLPEKGDAGHHAALSGCRRAACRYGKPASGPRPMDIRPHDVCGQPWDAGNGSEECGAPSAGRIVESGLSSFAHPGLGLPVFSAGFR